MKICTTAALLTLLTSSIALANIPFFDPPATGPATGPAGQSGAVIDPVAGKIVDDADLINNLTGVSDVGGPQSSKLHEITARMQQSTARLADKDAGRTTQEIQARIIASLDALIQQLKQSDRQNPDGRPSPSSTGARQPGARLSASRGAGMSPATSSDPKRGTSAAPSLSHELSELRKDFKGLPYRDRSAILNMKARDCLPEYKDMISRYYEALAETAKSGSHP